MVPLLGDSGVNKTEYLKGGLERSDNTRVTGSFLSSLIFLGKLDRDRFQTIIAKNVLRMWPKAVGLSRRKTDLVLEMSVYRLDRWVRSLKHPEMVDIEIYSSR